MDPSTLQKSAIRKRGEQPLKSESQTAEYFKGHEKIEEGGGKGSQRACSFAQLGYL